MLKKIGCVLIVLLIYGFNTGCASIIGKSKYPVVLDSHPGGCMVEVMDENGVKVFAGRTPSTTILSSGKGYFGKKSYTAKFSMEGYQPQMQPIATSLNGWYWGNILFGGLIGLLIVDPLTGAMYEVDTLNVMTSLPQEPAKNNFAQQQPPLVFSSDISTKLKDLKELLDREIINQQDYDKKKKELIDKM